MTTDQVSVCLVCSVFIFHEFITFVNNITKHIFVLRMLFLNFYDFQCTYVNFLPMWLVDFSFMYQSIYHLVLPLCHILQ